MKRRMRWSNVGRAQRRGIAAVGAVQGTLLLYALNDLRRRPRAHVRGRKSMWFPALFLNIVGPLAYLAVGRRRPPKGAEGRAERDA